MADDMADNNRSGIKEDIIEQIEKLDVLREKGFIAREEYEKKKDELLKSL